MAIAILVMFFTGRWINPSLFQAGLFLLGMAWAAALLCRPFKLRGGLILVPLAAAVVWGLFQLAAGHTMNRWNTWMAVLNRFPRVTKEFIGGGGANFSGWREMAWTVRLSRRRCW